MQKLPMHTTLRVDEAAERGMMLAVRAREHPERSAIVSGDRELSFDSLNRRANRLADALRRSGAAPGDGLALVCANRPEFVEVAQACLRSGLRFTPINRHLTAPELHAILCDSGARIVISDALSGERVCEASDSLPQLELRIAIDSTLPGTRDYEALLVEGAEEDLADPVIGTTMFYTAGTTGRSKGVSRPPGARLQAPILVARHARYDGERDRHLCAGPMYHAAPLAFSVMGPLAAGVGIVSMHAWDAEQALALIEERHITHTHLVPTMMHQLMAIDAEARTAADTSSLRFIVHGAAPCSVALKRRVIEWLGPILYEYYSASEGFGCFVTPEEWLAHPGTVGRPEPDHIQVRDDEGRILPVGEVGTLYLRAPDRGRFEYFGDPDKTRDTYDESGAYFSLGDVGRFDDDGYLHLCDRSADLIISGGVNIYPAEVDAVLLEHPSVSDAATIGVPHESYGESVHAVVELRPGIAASPKLESDLIAFCRERLARYKCPRSIEFSDALPRHETGKILRRLVRERARALPA